MLIKSTTSANFHGLGRIRLRFAGRAYFIGILLVTGIFIGGCGPIHRAREAQNLRDIPPGERTISAAEVGLDSGSTLTMDKAIDIALKSHPSIVQARQNVEIAKAQYRSAIGGYSPTLSASAGYRNSTSNVQGRPASNTSQHSYSAGLSMGMLLFDFGKTPAFVRQSYLDMISAEETLHSAVNDLTYQVTVAYHQLEKAKSLQKVAEDTERQFRVHLEQTQVLFEVGRRIKYDVTKAEVDLGNAQLNMISARNAVQTAQAALNQTMGLTEAPDYQIEAPPIENISSDIDLLMDTARENNPDLLALVAQELAATAGIDYAIYSLLPSISLGAGYNWNGNRFPLMWNWNFGPTLNWNLFDGFRNCNLIDQATAQLRAARARRAAMEQQIYLNLSQSIAQLENAQKRMGLADLIVQQAQENLNLVDERFRVGKASAVELTDAQVSLTSARSQQVQARYDYQTSVAQIKHTLGGKLP